MSKHTPGPWETDDHETHWSIMAGDQHVADVRAFNSPVTTFAEGDANARLITAAPNLLAACERALAWLEPFQDEEVCPERLALVECLQTAILKTEGPAA
jgi:hypothetical protein